jgi:prepilin-type N-terminal cleavage/methylation domain-containing protein
MKHRPGVTLIEVLVTIFIMGIGMLALLTLFPVGALSMGRALVYDRAAQAATNAEAIAIADDVRHDLTVAQDPLVSATVGFNAFTNPLLPGGTAVSAAVVGPSYGVFVDPWIYPVDVAHAIGTYGASPGMRRMSMSFTQPGPPGVAGAPLSVQQAGRWCSLTDDLFWSTANDGTPDTSAGSVRRGLTYTWAWHLRRPRAFDPSVIDMNIVIYRGRNTSAVSGETAFNVVAGTGTAGSNALTIDYSTLPAGTKPAVRLGRWVLDVSVAGNNAVPGYFYRVVDYTDNAAASQMELDLETPLLQTVTTVVLMEDVVEVVSKGTGWQP